MTRLRTRLLPSFAVLIAACVAATATLVARQPASQPADPPHVVVITIDGLKPETYMAADAPDLPTLRQLKTQGAFARGVVGVFPTVTYPSHTAMITGLPPAAHGIYNNRILDPEDRSNAGWYWYARDIAAPTLMGAVRARGLRVATVYWPVTVGADVDYLVPEFARSTHPESLTLLRALSRPGTLIDDVEAAAGQPFPYPLTDDARVEMASWIIRTHRPHLLLLHIFATDDAQHLYGPNTPEALAAIRGADKHVAKILTALEQAGLKDRANVVVLSDHGFLPVRQQLQLNALFKEEKLLDVDERGRIVRWDAAFQASGGSGFVFLKNPNDAALATRVRTIVERAAADPANGVERVILTEELRRIGADPRASFAVDMREGFYTGYGTDRLVAPASSRGGHGFFPTRPALHASLIMAGPNVSKRGDLGIVRMTQIGPTIASWFGVSLSPKADAPLQ